MTLFSLTPAALLNKSQWLGECPFTHLSMQLSISSSSTSLSLPCSLTIEADPHAWLGTCAGVNPNRGAMETGHGAAGPGSVSPWGVSQGLLRAHTPKKKADGSRNYPTHAVHLFPPPRPGSTPLPLLLFNQCPQIPLGLWSGRMSQCCVCPRSITSQGPCWLQHGPLHSHTFTNSRAQFMFMAFALLFSTKHLTDNKQKRGRQRNDNNDWQRIEATMVLRRKSRLCKSGQDVCFVSLFLANQPQDETWLFSSLILRSINLFWISHAHHHPGLLK